MRRVFASIILSIIVTFFLFFIMQRIIFNDKTAKFDREDLSYMDFIRVKPKTAEVKKQQKKRVQKKQKQMPKKVVLTSQRQNIQTKMPKMQPHPIDMPRDFKNSVSLNDIAINQERVANSPSNVGYSTDIIPIFTIPPNYPRMAKRRNVQGYVVLNFTIDKKGNVKNIFVKEAKPNGYFEKAAKEAIAKWKFKPKYSGDKAIEQLAQQRLEFSLR